MQDTAPNCRAPCIHPPCAAIRKFAHSVACHESSEGVIRFQFNPCPAQESAFSGVFRYLANGTEFTKVTKFEASGGCRQRLVPQTGQRSGLKSHWFDASFECVGSRCCEIKCSPAVAMHTGAAGHRLEELCMLPAVPLQTACCTGRQSAVSCFRYRTGAGAGRVLRRV